jgi:hypothetical protein
LRSGSARGSGCAGTAGGPPRAPWTGRSSGPARTADGGREQGRRVDAGWSAVRGRFALQSRDARERQRPGEDFAGDRRCSCERGPGRDEEDGTGADDRTTERLAYTHAGWPEGRVRRGMRRARSRVAIVGPTARDLSPPLCT